MRYRLPVYNDEGLLEPLEIEAENVFEAMEIARERKLKFVDDYISVCWYNGESIN